MKFTIPLALILFLTARTEAQDQTLMSSSVLTTGEIKRIFTPELKKKFAIDFNIFRIYSYADKTGQYYAVFTEKNDSISSGGDTLRKKIRAINLKRTATGLDKVWEINDFVTKQETADRNETSIWFWSKYFSFSDIDKDSIIDPIVVYGTSGMNGGSDGRIKILVYYKGQKSVIRHQNGELDFERHTQVDESYYALPASVQQHVKGMMEKMIQNSHAIFPNGWEKAMKNHRLKFDERSQGK